ncbi:hypothetical protein TL16_g07020 [Triparma laevis f. inornata]|uniref:Uncharacterized protein n=1 Tax=Triparma laevis f. inornata TaxID=1714386 RepID=A0A9W7AYJ5_9STRA|nr:hypothetical protein TL16_g07020 [Triparma laevis f. inornata]
MSSLLRKLTTGGENPATQPPTRTRNDSTSGIGLEDPSAVNVDHALFSNALKAITQGQPQLLTMFIKKHAHIVDITGPVSSPTQAQVDRETGKQVVLPEAIHQMTLLDCAVKQGSVEMSINVLEAMSGGRDFLNSVGNKYDKKMSAVHLAVRQDMISVVEKIIEIAKAGGLGDGEISEMFQSFMDGGGDDLVFACCASGSFNCLKYLVSNLQFDVNLVSPSGATCLHVAAARSTVPVTEFLLESGAIVDALDNDKLTPFFLASKFNNVPVMSALAKAGASIISPAQNGAEPIYVAAQQGHVQAIELLCDLKASPDSIGCGMAPLHVASMMGHPPVVKTLISKGANVNLQGGEAKNTPAHCAAQTGNVECLKALIEGGADIKMAGSTGATTLHLASWFGKKIIVETLLANGAVPDAKDENGKTPFDYSEDGYRVGGSGPEAKKVGKILKKACGEEGGKKKKKKEKKEKEGGEGGKKSRLSRME